MSTDSSAAGLDHAPIMGIGSIAPSTTFSQNWLDAVLRQLDAIKSLPRGWDSHGGDPIDADVVTAAAALAKNLAQYSQVPQPVVSPTTAGGVQFEWEADTAYFEVHLEEPAEAQCYFESQSPPAEKEFTFREGDDVSLLAKYVLRVGGA